MVFVALLVVLGVRDGLDVLVGSGVEDLTKGMRVPGLPISVGVEGLAFVAEAHGAGTVLDGVNVAVDRAFGALRLLGVLVGGWKVGCAVKVGHDGYAVVFCAFEGLLVVKMSSDIAAKRQRITNLGASRETTTRIQSSLVSAKRADYTADKNTHS